jgi:hypothetical protein
MKEFEAAASSRATTPPFTSAEAARRAKVKKLVAKTRSVFRARQGEEEDWDHGRP